MSSQLYEVDVFMFFLKDLEAVSNNFYHDLWQVARLHTPKVTTSPLLLTLRCYFGIHLSPILAQLACYTFVAETYDQPEITQLLAAVLDVTTQSTSIQSSPFSRPCCVMTSAEQLCGSYRSACITYVCRFPWRCWPTMLQWASLISLSMNWR